MLFLAPTYFYLSNPLLTVGHFEFSFARLWKLALVWFVLQLPWLRLPRLSWPLLAFSTWAGLSYFWSFSPDATLEALTLYLVMALIAAVVASNVDVRTLSAGLGAGGALVLAASLKAAYDGVPGAGEPPGGDGWLVGVGGNANILGYTLVPALAAVLAVPPRTRWGWLPWTVTAGFLAGGIVLSFSGTSMVAAVSVAACAALVGALRWLSSTRHWRLEVVGGVLLAMAFPTYQLISVVLLGRDVATLDGRVAVWSATLESSRPAIWIGNGWGAVWGHPWHIAPFNPVIARIQDRTDLPFTHGHNSFVDPLPELGWIGVLLLVVCHAAVAWSAFRLIFRSDRSPAARASGSFLLCVLVALVILGISEPLAVAPLGWFLLVLLLTMPRTISDPVSPGQRRPGVHAAAATSPRGAPRRRTRPPRLPA